MATIEKPMKPGARRALDIGSSFITATQGGLSEEEKSLIDGLPGMQSDEELATEKTAAEGAIAKSREKLTGVDTAGADVVARTEKQQMVEQIIQGLGSVLGGVLGEREGFTADIKTKPSDFGAILAGRMKDIENKRRTAEGEVTTAEQALKERLTRAERVRDMRSMNAVELAQAKAQAGLRLYMEDLQNKQRDKERAEKAAADEKEGTLGSVTALTQGISREAGDIEAIQKSIRTDIGALNSEKEEDRKQAISRIASTIGEDPTALQAADPAVVEARAAEYVAKKNQRLQALGTLSDKIALKTASKKKFSDDERQTLTAVREQLQPSNDLAVGQLRAVPAKGLTEISSVVKEDPQMSMVFTKFLQAKANTGLFSIDDPAIDIIQEKVLDPEKGMTSLTMDEISKLNSFKNPKTGKSLVDEFMSVKIKQQGDKSIKEIYQERLDTAVKNKDIKTLRKLAPQSEIGVKGFGE